MTTTAAVFTQAQTIAKALLDRRNIRETPSQDLKELAPDENQHPSWMTFCPAHNDTSTPSLHVSFHDKVLVKCRAGCSQGAVIDALRQLNLWPKASGSNIVINQLAHDNIPDNWNEILLDEYGHTPDVAYEYQNEKGQPIFWVLRCNQPKIIKPLVSVTYIDSNTAAFQQRHIPNNRPLYNLRRINLCQQVLLVEGEKTCDMATRLFPEKCCSTWAGGTGAVAQTNWLPLKGKHVILFPDNDQPGIKAMEDIASLLFSQDPEAKVSIVFRKINELLPKGWDLADTADGDNRPQAMLDQAEELTVIAVNAQLANLNVLIEEFRNKFIPLGIGREIILVDTTKPGGLGYLESIPYTNYESSSQYCYSMFPQQVLIPGEKKPVYAIQEFVSHHISDLIHQGIVYDPSTTIKTIKKHGQMLFNLFNGFPYIAKLGNNHQLFIDHIHLLLGDRAEYVWDWVAHIIQKPKEKPGTIIILTGAGGTGKSLTGRLICELLGQNNAVEITPQKFTSRFNGWLSGKLFVYIDELYMPNMNVHSYDELKSLVSQEDVQIEHKHRNTRSEASYHRFLSSTNNIMPYKIDFGARRDNIFRVETHKHTEDKSYFTDFVSKMYDNETMCNLKHFLLERKIKHDVRQALVTRERNVMYQPSNKAWQFLYDILYSGKFPYEFAPYEYKKVDGPIINNWPDQVVELPSSAIANYINKQYKSDMSQRAITEILKPFLADISITKTAYMRYNIRQGNVAADGGKETTLIFPPVERLRKKFDEYTKAHIEWPSLIDDQEDLPKNVVPMQRRDVL